MVRASWLNRSFSLIRQAGFLGAFGVLAASGCSLKAPSDSSRIYLDLSELTRRGVDSTRDLAREFGFGGGPIALAVPTGWGDFQCYGVNVVGPGIPDSSNDPNHDPGQSPAQVYGDMLTGKTCAYRGVISSPVAAGTPNGNVELQVPTGPGRIVQIVGSIDSPMCASGFQDGTSGIGPKLYEIGRTKIDLYGDRSLSIPVSPDSLAGKEVDCEGGCQDIAGQAVDTNGGVDVLTISSGDGFAFEVPSSFDGHRFGKVLVSLKWFGTPSSVQAKVYRGAGMAAAIASGALAIGETHTVASGSYVTYEFALDSSLVKQSGGDPYFVAFFASAASVSIAGTNSGTPVASYASSNWGTALSSPFDSPGFSLQDCP